MTKKGKKGVLKTAVNKERFILYQGVELTVAFMAVMGEVKRKLEKRKELTEALRIEVGALINLSAHILEFFRVSPQVVGNILKRVKPEHIEKESERMVKELTSRIIIPGQQRPGIIIPQIDARKVLKDLKAKKEKRIKE